jgi:tripartite-type tricarboxylate transporter receptor subunit TctC
LFNTKIKIISGYKGGNEVFLAMERGEVDGRCGGLVSSINSTRPEWFAQKKVNIPVVFALERSPQFPDAPAVGELAKDERTKQIVQLILSPLAMDRPILLPPGAPADKIAALRKAFHETMEDPAFIAEAQKQGLDIDDVPGEKVAKIIQEAFAFSPEIIKAANEAMSASGATEK